MALTVSIMTGGSNSHETTSEEANGIATDFVSEGIIGSYTNTSGVAPATGAFAVNAQGTPDMTVAVSSGVAYVTGTPTSQNSQTFRVYNSASSNVTIAANSSGSTKYDWVYIKLDATLLANPTLAGTTTATLVTSRSTSSSTDNGTPPTYGYPIAVVTVANGASSITNATIADVRTGQAAILSGVNDTNGNELIKFTATSSAVNEITAANAATGNAPSISATGGDTNIDLRLKPKGTGNVKRGATGGAIDWYEEIGRTTLSVAGDTISVTSLPSRKYLKIIVTTSATGGTINARLRFNNDTGANYSERSSANGGADGTAVSQTSMGLSATASAADRMFVGEVRNVLAQEKLLVGLEVEQGTAGAGNVTSRAEIANKWANTAAVISQIDIINTGTGDFAIGSECVVLGHD